VRVCVFMCVEVCVEFVIKGTKVCLYKCLLTVLVTVITIFEVRSLEFAGSMLVNEVDESVRPGVIFCNVVRVSCT
jgi:hypothetical protein